MVQRREPDDLCPSCGVPVPFERRGLTCPYCGHEFELPIEGPATTGYLTTFGYGLCGLIIGAEIGATVALMDPGLRLGDPRITLFPILGGMACALLAAAVGTKLSFSVRRGYEIALLSCMAGGLAACALALSGVQSAEALNATGACAALLAAPLIRRYAYPQRRGPTS